MCAEMIGRPITSYVIPTLLDFREESLLRPPFSGIVIVWSMLTNGIEPVSCELLLSKRLT